MNPILSSINHSEHFSSKISDQTRPTQNSSWKKKCSAQPHLEGRMMEVGKKTTHEIAEVSREEPMRLTKIIAKKEQSDKASVSRMRNVLLQSYDNLSDVFEAERKATDLDTEDMTDLFSKINH